MDKANAGVENAIAMTCTSELDGSKSEIVLEVARIEEKDSSLGLPCLVEENTIEMNNHLPPDHPLLARFQQTLKEHLLRLKGQLTEDIDVIKHKIKVKEQEREDVGVKLYDMQQDIDKQNNLLDEYSHNIESIVKKRIEEEHVRDELRREYEVQLAETNERKARYNEHMLELNHVVNLENSVRKFANEFEDELITAKRTVSKDEQIQRENAQEKRQTDLLVFNLGVEVKKRKEELAALEDQIGEQRRANNILQGSLSDACADLETLQQEHKHLTQAWGQVIVAIQHRDKVFLQARDELMKQTEKLKLLKSSIGATMKQRAKETDENIKLNNFRQRLENDLVDSKRDVVRKEKELERLDMKATELPEIINQTESDYNEAKKESNQLMIALNTIQFKLDRENTIKSRYEREILKLVQDQLMCDKASQHRIKVLGENQVIRRNMDSNLVKIGKQLSNLLMKLDQQKNMILRLKQEGTVLSSTLKDRNEESDETSKQLKEMQSQINLKMKLIENLSGHLDSLLKEAEGCEMSPTDYKIKSIEKAISDTDEKVQEHQQFWLILQGHIVHLHEKRNNQLNDTQVMRKQLLIVNQKSLKIDNDIEKAETCANDIDREIEKCSTKLELLSATCFEKKKQHELVEFDCNTEHADLLNRLKDNEMRVLELEQECIDLQNEIECYTQQALELHREALSWETKYKLLEDTVRWRRQENATESEIGNMRAEIHRMQIRYKELRRAQEKLIQDLDHCVMHRETIFVNASTRQKMEGAHFRSRNNTQQRIHDVKTKLKNVQYEINVTEKKLNELVREHSELERAEMEIKKQMNEEIERNRQVIREIEQGILLKHQNLETLVRKQNRAKEYRRLTSTSSLTTWTSKSEASIEFNSKRQAEINHHLIEVVETLLNEFPDKDFALSRIAQTLHD